MIKHPEERPTLQNLQIDRPIAFLDVETTGLSVSVDRIVEMSILKIAPDGSQEQKTRRFNPGRSIEPQATEVHGITDQDLADEPDFSRVATSLRNYLEDCDIAGFGVIYRYLRRSSGARKSNSHWRVAASLTHWSSTTVWNPVIWRRPMPSTAVWSSRGLTPRRVMSVRPPRS